MWLYKMKKPFIIILPLLLLLGSVAIAQEEDYPYYRKDWKDTIPEGQEPVLQEKKKRVYDEPGTFKAAVSIGMGVMNSEDINNYIEQDLLAQGIHLVSGTSNMESILLGGLQLYYVVTPQLQVKGIFDYALGVSATEIINQSEIVTYTASRVSVGVGGNFYFLKSRVRPYLGGAIFYHALSFEGYKGSTFGPRAELGVAFNFTEKFKMEVFGQVDSAKTKAEKQNQSITIDFNSINVGARFLFNL